MCSIVVLIMFSVSLIHAEVVSMTSQEESMCLRHLIPLPHEISIGKKITLKPSAISIKPAGKADGIVRNAFGEMVNLFKEKTGSMPNGNDFTIVIGIAGDDGKLDGTVVRNYNRSKSLPNNEQAYIIQPDGEKALLITGLNGKGVYYAAATLIQLLEPFMSEKSVTIPLAEVVDWPDLEERGLWNFQDPPTWIPWLSSLKLNYGKMAATKLHTVEKGKKNHATIDKELMMKARLTGFNYLPFIMHFNFLHGYGLFREYPELAGIGDSALSGRYFAHKSGSQHRVPCMSKPLFTDILTEWMMDIASQGADEVSCWLSERPAQCGCDECTAIGQFVLEARACVDAWRETMKTYPDFIIRLFISTTTAEKYYRVCAEAPPEVRLERCCASWVERVLHMPRDLYVNTLFDRYASEGRWVANYDVPLGSYGRVDTPEFKIPCSSAHRIRDFVSQLIERKYAGAYGMMAWNSVGEETYGFNLNALAEWSWNRDGRSEKEFVIAWATREGYKNPEAVAEWSEIMGPIEFDVYDSEFPVCYSWGQATQMVENKERPYLGEGLFRYYLSPDDFDKKIAACNRAHKIAGQFENTYLADETAVVRSYVNLVKHVYLVAELVATDELTTLESQNVLREHLAGLEKAGKENVVAIKAWRSGIGPEPWHYRVHDAIKGTETTVKDISQHILGKYFY